jgi:alginate O-acetyltransferase complex protein AlgI
VGNIFLILISLIFYAWGDIRHVWLLVISIMANYFLAGLISRGLNSNRPNLAKSVFAGAIIFNLALLAVTKYLYFFGNSLALISAKFPLPFTFQSHAVAGSFPIGISFFTLSAISYIADIYNKKTFFEINPVATALYISFFPKILMGPIVTYKDMSLQIRHRTITADKALQGIEIFIIGLGKKVIIANTLAITADQIFKYSAGQLSVPVAWLGAICYTLQIYFDFSGYSDMAIGMARMAGFEFAENFHYPYLSTSIRQFWQRWHISLGKWFREYLYIPLGGNRRGPIRVYLNLLVIFFLCGLWHSPSWRFVIWGLWHGLFMVLERAGLIRLEGKWRFVGCLYTLLIVMIGWVIFRSSGIFQGMAYLSVMFGLSSSGSATITLDMILNAQLVLMLICGIIGCFPLFPLLSKAILNLQSKFKSYRWMLPDAGFVFARFVLLFLILILSGVTLAGSSYRPFIYAQF